MTSTPQPAGINGKWNLVFDDEFTGTEINGAHWGVIDGWGSGPLTNHASNVRVDKGQLVLIAPAVDSGARVSSDPAMGAGTGFMLPLGGIVEARITLPKPGSWPTFWVTGDNANWPAAGEVDIVEGGDNYTVNYHDSAGAESGLYAYSSSVVGSPHIYTFERGSGPDGYEVYLDGRLIAKWTGNDDGDDEAITLSIGNTNGTFPDEMLVDYVRVWAAA